MGRGTFFREFGLEGGLEGALVQLLFLADLVRVSNEFPAILLLLLVRFIEFVEHSARRRLFPQNLGTEGALADFLGPFLPPHLLQLFQLLLLLFLDELESVLEVPRVSSHFPGFLRNLRLKIEGFFGLFG